MELADLQSPVLLRKSCGQWRPQDNCQLEKVVVKIETLCSEVAFRQSWTSLLVRE
jgi:hypothetical protein